MTQKDSINEAIKMIETHDWNWRYADYGYETNYYTAMCSMRAFVKFVATIDNADVREALRHMWTLCFKEKREEYRTRKAELLNAYAS